MQDAPPPPNQFGPSNRGNHPAAWLLTGLSILFCLAAAWPLVGKGFSDPVRLLVPLFGGFIGFIAAVVGLILGRGHLPVVLVGVFGLLCACGDVSAAGAMLLKSGFSRATQARSAKKDLEAAMSEINEAQRNALKDGDSAAALNTLQTAQARVSEAAEKMTGEDGRSARASAAFLAYLAEHGKAHEQAVAALQDAQVFQFNPPNEATLSKHRQLVDTFMDTNVRIRSAIQNAEQAMQTEMKNAGCSPNTINAALRGFSTKFTPRRQITLQIRNKDTEIGRAALEMLRVLSAERGKWRVTDEGHVFENAAASEIFEAELAKINAASEEQIALQQRMAEIQ